MTNALSALPPESTTGRRQAARVAVFEMAESPKGRLISFDADPAQALALASLAPLAWLDLLGDDVAASDALGPALVFPGAGPAAAAWAESGSAAHVLAFPSGGRPSARLLQWGPTSDQRA